MLKEIFRRFAFVAEPHNLPPDAPIVLPSIDEEGRQTRESFEPEEEGGKHAA